jgi:hypothetical protein
VGLIVMPAIIFAVAALFSSMKDRSSARLDELSANAGDTAAAAASDTDAATNKDEKNAASARAGFYRARQRQRQDAR